MVAGEPLRRVGAPTPRLLCSPPLAKVQSHSHHLLRQVLFAYLAVPPCLVELVVIAILHHSLLHCVVHNPCHPIPRLSVGKFELGVIPGSRRRRPRRFGRRRGGGGRARRCALVAPAGARRASAQCAQPVLVHLPLTAGAVIVASGMSFWIGAPRVAQVAKAIISKRRSMLLSDGR